MPWFCACGTRTWHMPGSATATRRPMRRWSVVLVAPLLALALAPAGARADTTTTSSTTTTSLPPALTNPAALPSPGAGGSMSPTMSSTIEAPAEESPPATTTVPVTPTAPPPVDPALLASLHQQLLRAQRASTSAHAAERAAEAQAAGLTVQLSGAQADVETLRAKEHALVTRFESARARLARQALAAYTGDSLSAIELMLEARDINDLAR